MEYCLALFSAFHSLLSELRPLMHIPLLLSIPYNYLLPVYRRPGTGTTLWVPILEVPPLQWPANHTSRSGRWCEQRRPRRCNQQLHTCAMGMGCISRASELGMGCVNKANGMGGIQQMHRAGQHSGRSCRYIYIPLIRLHSHQR